MCQFPSLVLRYISILALSMTHLLSDTVEVNFPVMSTDPSEPILKLSLFTTSPPLKVVTPVSKLDTNFPLVDCRTRPG